METAVERIMQKQSQAEKEARGEPDAAGGFSACSSGLN